MVSEGEQRQVGAFDAGGEEADVEADEEGGQAGRGAIQQAAGNEVGEQSGEKAAEGGDERDGAVFGSEQVEGDGEQHGIERWVHRSRAGRWPGAPACKRKGSQQAGSIAVRPG